LYTVCSWFGSVPLHADLDLDPAQNVNSDPDPGCPSSAEPESRLSSFIV
jgi:hypothetical protein